MNEPTKIVLVIVGATMLLGISLAIAVLAA